MHAWIRRALCAVGLTGGIVLLGIGLAEASSADGNSGPVTSGENGIVSGNQTAVGVQAPVNASGNQVTVIGQRNHLTSAGTSSTGTSGGGGTGGGTTSHPTTSGESGIGSGNQTAVNVQAPINASGNQVTVIGQDNTDHAAGGTSTSTPPSGSPTTTGEHGIVSGNQTGITALVPINVSGNQVTVIGQDNDLHAVGGSTTGTPTGGSGGTSSGSPTTSGESGIGSGNQTGITALIPVNLSGNQVTVIGQDNTNTSAGGSTTGGSTGGSGGGATTSGENGIGSGNQTGITALVPVNASGNQITVIGQDNTNTSTGGSTTSGGGSTTTGGTTTGAGGGGSGNQTPVVVQVPVNTTGNQVTVVGQDNTNTSTGGTSTGGTTGGTTGSTPGGTVVSPPTTTGSGGTPAAASAPAAAGLPQTGLPRGLGLIALLGLLLLTAGALCLRPRRAMVPVR